MWGGSRRFPTPLPEPVKVLLQVRLELTTSALLRVLPYKYRALTDCATGAPAADRAPSRLPALRPPRPPPAPPAPPGCKPCAHPCRKPCSHPGWELCPPPPLQLDAEPSSPPAAKPSPTPAPNFCPAPEPSSAPAAKPSPTPAAKPSPTPAPSPAAAACPPAPLSPPALPNAPWLGTPLTSSRSSPGPALLPSAASSGGCRGREYIQAQRWPEAAGRSVAPRQRRARAGCMLLAEGLGELGAGVLGAGAPGICSPWPIWAPAAKTVCPPNGEGGGNQGLRD